MVPPDLKTVMSSLLSEAQFWIWERAWRQHLKELLEVYQANPQTVFLIMYRLSGEGNMAKPQDQAAALLIEILNDIKNAAKRVLLCMPSPTTPSEGYAAIRQRPDENFVDVFDRLREARGKKVEDPRMQKELLRSLAKENAKRDCETVLKALLPELKPAIE